MKCKIILLFSTVLSICFFTACNNGSETTSEGKDTTGENNMMHDNTMQESTMNMDTMMNAGFMSSMNTMMGKMSSMKMSGDFDMDFASMMIEHHEGALEMAQVEVSQGKDEKLQKIAGDILTKQKQEQDELKSFVKNYKPSGMKHGEGELQTGMSGIMNKMKAMQMSGNTDKDFATMMSYHHENSIAMSKMELKNGMDNKLKQMAKKMMADQTKEINDFTTWLTSNK